MCDVCGKFMRSDNLKRHMIAKHGNGERGKQLEVDPTMIFKDDGKNETRGYDTELAVDVDKKKKTFNFP